MDGESWNPSLRDKNWLGSSHTSSPRFSPQYFVSQDLIQGFRWQNHPPIITSNFLNLSIWGALLCLEPRCRWNARHARWGWDLLASSKKKTRVPPWLRAFGRNTDRRISLVSGTKWKSQDRGIEGHLNPRSHAGFATVSGPIRTDRVPKKWQHLSFLPPLLVAVLTKLPTHWS